MSTSLYRRAEKECRLVHQAEDKCAFILENCQDDEAGLIPYLTFYYCGLGQAQPLAFVILVLWLGLLFATIGIAASDFFSVNLSTIASILGLSESLAGVTFLALGNGSPDVFSTFAAMGSNSGSMAVGELIGAASFITAVVAGSMALVREFKVSRKTFVRDICFFIASVSFAMVFLADGRLNLWECCVMIGFYVFYVITVVGWHWYSTRRRKRRAKEAASRGHFYGVAGDGVDELEPYRDEDEDDADAAPLNRRQRAATADIGVLERGPRIEIEAPDDDLAEDEDDERGRHITAEMTSSMRVTRPRGMRSNTTITPIRPSLVGVLEFRSILSSLQKSGNVHLAPISGRRDAENPALEYSTVSVDALGTAPQLGTGTFRDRALSSGDMPLNLDNAQLPAPAAATQPGASTDSTHGQNDTPQGPGGNTGDGAGDGYQHSEYPPRTRKSPSLQLQIPSPRGLSPHSSPGVSPFPRYTDSPMPLAGAGSTHEASFGLGTPALSHHLSFPGIEDHGLPKPVRWWPYQILPAPHVLLTTLFPTLQNWQEKAIWDKFISVISVPSIFLLVTTLPVVETESKDDDSDQTLLEGPRPGEPGNTAPAASTEPNASIEPETEWQRYRRNTRTSGSRSQSHLGSPLLIAIDDGQGSQAGSHGLPHSPSTTTQQPIKPATGDAESNEQTTVGDELPGWNRWLVCLQLFTGPLFTVFIVWANLEETPKMLIRLVLYSLLGSLVLLAAVLVTTSPDKRPKYHFLLCFLGFIISVAWISTIAGEVVGVLKAFGVIIGISEAILGLTIFAVGNSVGDLVADVTVARLGYPVMAL